nr:HAD family phosphatase [Dactylosporangium thailandense]
MPDVILFDLFGVIARHQSQAGRDTLVEIAGLPEADFWQSYWHQRVAYDAGHVTGAEYWRRVSGFTEERIAALIEADIASWSEVDEEMVGLLERAAAAGVRLALLSNIPEELAAHYERHHRRWLRHFELVAFSCRIGLAKPDPAAYRWCCRELGLAPDHLLFVDDRDENIAAAQRVGLHTHLFVGLGLDLVQRVGDLGTR